MPEIILLCEHYGARAYINIAGKDFDALQKLMLKKLCDDVCQNNVRNPRKCLNSAAGELKSRGPKWIREEAIKAAGLGISFDTLSIHGYKWYEELSQITDGIYAPFSSSNKTSQLVEVAAYSRGGDMTKQVFFDAMASANASGDTEMINTYAAYSKKVVL